MTVRDAALPGIKIIEPDVYGDARGYFFEMWNAARYRDAGIETPFVQDNLSRSERGVLRGLHFQNPNPQAKLITVLTGSVYDVLVDVRSGSDTFGAWTSVTLSGDAKRQLFVPEGFAHGFLVTSETALFHYKCSAHYDPASEVAIRWDDPTLGIDWPVDDPTLSDKDRAAPVLQDLPAATLRWSDA